MNKKKLKIYFADFWSNFQFKDNYFYHLLNTYYDVEVTPNNPNVLFHSNDYFKKEEYKKFEKTKKIFFTGENVVPNLENSNYSFSFSKNLGPNNYRLPLWVLFIDWFNSEKSQLRDPSYLIPVKKLTSTNKPLVRLKPFFCSFIASKPLGKRVDFVPKLNDIKKVHSLGRLYSNSYLKATGRGDQKNKLNYMKLFRFNIAFENSISDGYVTEKILHSFFARSIPIYWGSEEVTSDFNPNAFINYSDYKSDDELIHDVIAINNNKERYYSFLEEPIFKNNEIPKFCRPESVLRFLKEVIEQ